MRKIILVMMLFISIISVAQNHTFVRKYTNYFTNINNVESESLDADVTVVFNENNQTTIAMYIDNEVFRYHLISEVTKGETVGGYEYQVFECISEKDGAKVSLQLFENHFRIHEDKSYIEFSDINN
jgi:hypothetical protein